MKKKLLFTAALLWLLVWVGVGVSSVYFVSVDIKLASNLMSIFTGMYVFKMLGIVVFLLGMMIFGDN